MSLRQHENSLSWHLRQQVKCVIFFCMCDDNNIDHMGLVIGSTWCTDTEKMRTIGEQRVVINRQGNELLSARSRINELTNKLNETERLAQDYERYKDLFMVPGDIADYIMSTELHMEWMDDATERDYIVSLLDFLQKFVDEQAYHESDRTSSTTSV